MELLIDGAYGVYVPQRFAQRYAAHEFGICKTDWQTLLAGPENPDYWEVWDEVLANAKTAKDEYLWQDGDLFLVGPEDQDF